MRIRQRRQSWQAPSVQQHAPPKQAHAPQPQQAPRQEQQQTPRQAHIAESQPVGQAGATAGPAEAPDRGVR